MEEPISDTVTLQVPKDGSFLPLLRLILGGIGLRRDLSFDDLDDIQLAVDNLLAEDGEGEELTVAITVSERELRVRLRVLTNENLRATLVQGKVPPEAEGRCLDVCLILAPLVDSYEVREVSEGGFAVELLKQVG